MSELFDDATRTMMRDAARDAAIEAAKAFGFGGAGWTIERYAGDGTTEERTPEDAGSLTGYAYRQRPGPAAVALSGGVVLDDIWRMIVVSVTMDEGDALVAGDVLTSVADGRQVTVKSVEPWYDYQRCELERER